MKLQLKNNKAPGPDNLTTEVFKMMSGDNIKIIEKLYQEWWQSKKIPDEITH